ncbi:MAG: hypothetical protein K5842_05705 [Bacteroidales bacterium]|nr:hypothetical protein [Bacteroidales bacterium]
MEKVSKTLEPALARVHELVERMDKNEGGIPVIERDMLLAELRQMYDMVYRIGEPVVGNSVSVESDAEELTPVAETPLAAVVVEAVRKEEAVKEDVIVLEEQEEQDEEPAQDEETEILMTDTDAEPLYAEEPETEESSTPDDQQPSIEDLEGRQNDDLFEESEEPSDVEEAETVEATAEPSVVEEPAKPAGEEAPQTLWDKLQSPMGGSTIADKIGTSRTVSDLFKEKKEDNLSEPAAPEPTPEPDEENLSNEENDASQPSLFDYFRTTAEKPVSRTIADSLGENQKQNTETGGLAANKVTDLRTIININDKFSFMNELFHNNMKGYNDFILKLNALSDREEALAYVESVSLQYGWDNESLAVKTFYAIFDRKF